MNTDLRPIVAEDFPEMDEIYVPYAGHGFPRDRVLSCLGTYPTVIAISDDEVVGFAYTLSFAPDIAELGNIYIRPDFRTSGLGGRLLGFIEERMTDPMRYLIAVNSKIRKTNYEKKDPTNFYLRSGFEILRNTGGSTVFWRDIRGAAPVTGEPPP